MKIQVITCSAYSPLGFTGNSNDYTLLSNWLDTLNISTGRAPKGMKTTLVNLIFIKKQVGLNNDYGGNFGKDNIINTLSRWTDDDIKLINTKFAKKQGETDTIKTNNAIFVNKSIMSYANFKKKVSLLDKFLSSLTGYHKKSLKGSVTIWFVKKELSKAAAKYKRDKDIMYIRPDKVISGDNYGSAIYVLLHELGHRWENLYKSPVDFDKPEWYTTKYSRTSQSFGSESFAELFALSQWPDKYKEYSGKIARFKQLIK